MTIHHNGVIYYRMAEKRKPTYDLQAFKAVFSTVQRLAVTGVALRSAAALGFGRSEIVETIQTMQREHFYKSMTSYADSQLGRTYIMFPRPLVFCISNSPPMF